MLAIRLVYLSVIVTVEEEASSSYIVRARSS